MKKVGIIIICILCSNIVLGQKYNKEYLQNQNRKIQQEIAKLNKVLADTKKESQSSLVYVVTLNNKIDKRAEMIANANKEKRFIEDDIYLKKLEINKYRRELQELRKDYGKVLVKAYKNKTVQNKMMFVLSSKDLGQAFRRVKYLQLYSDYQDDKAAEIRDKIAAIEKLKSSREKDIQEKKTLLAKQEVEMKKLEAEKTEKNKVVAQFKSNEKQLLADLRKKQIEEQKIESQIQLAIAEEIEIARKKEAERLARIEAERKEKERLAQLEADRIAKENAAKASTKPTSKPTTKAEANPIAKVEPSTPKTVEIPKSEYEKLSDNFEANKGRLPNPMPGSVVLFHYGKYTHPITGLVMNNIGVELSGASNSILKAVFNGVVTRVFKSDGNLVTVLIQHGEYYTVYSNIDDPYVRQGDNVKTGQDIGHVFVNNDNRAISKIQVWKGREKQNPETWLRLY